MICRCTGLQRKSGVQKVERFNTKERGYGVTVVLSADGVAEKYWCRFSGDRHITEFAPTGGQMRWELPPVQSARERALCLEAIEKTRPLRCDVGTLRETDNRNRLSHSIPSRLTNRSRKRSLLATSLYSRTSISWSREKELYAASGLASKRSNQTMKPTAPSKCAQHVCHDTLPWLISFSLDRMRHLASLALTVLVASCVSRDTYVPERWTVTYYDRNHDGIVDFELHTLGKGHADADWVIQRHKVSRPIRSSHSLGIRSRKEACGHPSSQKCKNYTRTASGFRNSVRLRIK